MTRAAAITEHAYLTPPEVARLLRVDPHTVHGWVQSGELPASNLARRGSRRPRWRIARADLEVFLASRAAIPPTPRGPPRRRSKDYAIWV